MFGVFQLLLLLLWSKKLFYMFYKCFSCGCELVWEPDVMLSDFDSSVSCDEDLMITYAHCPNCGSEYEFCDGFEPQDWENN